MVSAADSVNVTEKEKNRAYGLLTGGFGGLSAVVAGDFMLDRYISGEVSRISPEAPVPVVRVNSERSVAGGAGNVAANLAGLGVSLTAIGSVGDDADGRALLSLPLFDSIDVSGVLRLGATTVKTRVLGAGRQQMLRLDREYHAAPDKDDIASVLSKIKAAADAGARLVILSDYGKGFCSPELCREVVAFSRLAGIPVWVDPKKDDWEPYRGASVITPNLKELSAAAGERIPNEDGAVTEAARRLAREYDIGAVLATRSEKGATLVEGGDAVHIPVGSMEVYDVSGAGDTMLAVAAAFAAEGFPLAEAASIANTAAQIVIGRVGTYAIKACELLAALCGESAPEPCGAVSWDEAERLCNIWRARGEKIIFTNGCFDIVHAGHADSLTAAKALGDRLIVGLNSDGSVRRLKGCGRPVNCEAARARVLSAFKAVDAVVVFDEDTPAELLSRLRPDVAVKGGDYRPEDVAGGEYAKEVVILPLTAGYSTTGIIKKAAGTK